MTHYSDDFYLALPFPLGYGGLPASLLEKAFQRADDRNISDPLHRRMAVLDWLRQHFQQEGDAVNARHLRNAYHKLRHVDPVPNTQYCVLCETTPIK